MTDRSTDRRTFARAGAVFVRVGEVLGPSEVRWDERGVITDVRPCASLTEGERASVLAPGFVNAHAHLDLGGLAGIGEVGLDAGGEGFVSWVGRVIAARAAWGPEERRRGLSKSVERALAAGTTSVVDVDSTGWSRRELPAAAPRVVRCRELLDASPTGSDSRTAECLARLERLADPGAAPSSLVVDGVSPHGVHTVGDQLLAAVGQRVGGAEGLLNTVHWAETAEEVRWLLSGEGPFASWLGPSPRCSGAERLARAGALAGALLVHGNHPTDGELGLLREHGAAVVHCPGSHLYFGRDPFPYPVYRDAGVPVLLGTDSLGSNAGLDMGREARIAVQTLGIGAEEAWRLVTEVAASWLPWPEVTGRLEAGAAADIVRHARRGAAPPREAAELLDPRGRVTEVFVAGRVVHLEAG
ncbi:MAG: amidohydrolase family protein [Planctomycetota bacterium]|nr:amidohydrolase family protein [Planctomycetota bacterium]